jgi:CheY-like chemotaxis protein
MVVADMDGMLRRLIGEDIELRIELCTDVGQVLVDPGQLEQVVLNLVVNARDAMPEGGRLTIETSAAEIDSVEARSYVSLPPGSYAVLSVSDTGVGMDAATRARIFEPFFTTKGPGKGTGLGLATVYGILKQSGGDIQVYSVPRHGTTFKIYLPRVDAAPVDERQAEAAVLPPRGLETVLLAEDEDAVRRLVREMLERLGYTVLEAGSGVEALELCREHPGSIDLLLTDLVMPRMGGRQLAQRAAELRPRMPVLYMSGYTDDALTEGCPLDEGAAFLQKPFTLPALARLLRQLLDR